VVYPVETDVEKLSLMGKIGEGEMDRGSNKIPKSIWSKV